MEINIDVETQKLVQNRLMETNEQIGSFEDALANIFSLNEAKHIPALCMGFDDSTEQQDVMFGLIHTIESYDQSFGIEVCTRQFIAGVKNMVPHATKWLEIILIRYLNDDASRNVLKKELGNADAASKKIISEALNQLIAKGGEFSTRIKEVLA